MTKKCSKCGETKPIVKFLPCKGNGLASWCRSCVTKLRCDRNYRNAHPEVAKRAQLKHKYGLTLEQHKQMYLDQNGCCAVCGEPIEYDRVVTDHDHETGKVRGLLCYRCNRDLSIFDDTDRFERAIAYIERNR